MTRSYGPLLFLLAAIWGASYLFIKVGVRDFEPSFFVTLRLLIGGALLFAFLAAREGGREALTSVRSTWRDEPLRPSMLGGLSLILGGVALGSGAWRPIRPRTALESST
jgi:drug/metabolite transporter (DMT)-like permease